MVEEAIKQALHIRESIDMLAEAKDKAILLSHGIRTSSSSSNSEDEASDEQCSDTPFDSFVEPEETPCAVPVDFSTVPLKDIVETSKSNIFQVAEAVEANLQRSLTKEELDDLLKYVLYLQDCDSYLICQSYQALLASNAESWMDRQTADLVNGLIVRFRK